MRLLPLFFALFALACSSSPTQDPSTKKGPEVPQTPKEDAAPERRATAFGLPLPPRVRSIEERPGYVVVHTDLNVRQIYTFFRENTPEGFEVLKTGYKVQLVGLKDFQPEVTATHVMGQRSPVRLIYRSIRKAPRVQFDKLTPEGKRAYEKRQEMARKRNIEATPTPGAPVLLRTKSGELLAPGAHWGEPYIPPKGSPLDKPHLRSNFGRPFGTWQPG